MGKIVQIFFWLEIYIKLACSFFVPVINKDMRLVEASAVIKLGLSQNNFKTFLNKPCHPSLQWVLFDVRHDCFLYHTLSCSVSQLKPVLTLIYNALHLKAQYINLKISPKPESFLKPFVNCKVKFINLIDIL